MPKKEAKVDRVARKRCFFTAGALLFSSDGTIFDKLLYYMFENLMSFNEKTRSYGKCIRYIKSSDQQNFALYE